jgi:hypothetical protein
LLTRMTGTSLHMQWPLTYQLQGSVSKREQLFFSLRSKLHALVLSHFVFVQTCLERSQGYLTWNKLHHKFYINEIINCFLYAYVQQELQYEVVRTVLNQPPKNGKLLKSNSPQGTDWYYPTTLCPGWPDEFVTISPKM